MEAAAIESPQPPKTSEHARFRQLEGRVGGGSSSSSHRKPTTSEKELNTRFQKLWGGGRVVVDRWW